MPRKKSNTITFKFDDSPASQARANALISALSGRPFPPKEEKPCSQCGGRKVVAAPLYLGDGPGGTVTCTACQKPVRP